MLEINSQIKIDKQSKDLKAGDQPITTLCRMCEQGCGLEVSLGPDGRPANCIASGKPTVPRAWRSTTVRAWGTRRSSLT